MQKNLLIKTVFIVAVLLIFAYGIFGSPRSGELGMMLRGIAHGVRGITGKLDPR